MNNHNSMRSQAVFVAIVLCVLLPVHVLSEVCIYGDIRNATIMLGDKAFPFSNETNICCNSFVCQQAIPYRFNGPITQFVNPGYPYPYNEIYVGHFDSVNSTFTGPIFDRKYKNVLIDWNQQRRSKAESITEHSSRGGYLYGDRFYCVHGVFYLQRRHEPYRSLVYSRYTNRTAVWYSLSVPGEQKTQIGCLENTIASLVIDAPSYRYWVYIEEPSATDERVPIGVIITARHSTYSTETTNVSLRDNNKQQLYYGRMERPQKLVSGKKFSSEMQLCVVTNVQRLICGAYHFEGKTWTYQNTADDLTMHNINHFAHITYGDASVTIEAGPQYFSLTDIHCDSSECNGQFEIIDGEVYFATLSNVRVEDTAWIRDTVFSIASGVSLSLLIGSLLARKRGLSWCTNVLIVVTVSALLIYNIITISIREFFPVPSIILLQCIMVQKSASQPLVWRDRTLVAAMFAAVCSASVPSIYFSNLYNFGEVFCTSFTIIMSCSLVSDIAVTAALIRYIRTQPKSSRKPLIGLVIFISVITVICMGVTVYTIGSLRVSYYWRSSDADIISWINLSTSILVLVCWVTAAIWIRITAKRLPIPSKLLHTTFVYSLLHVFQPVSGVMLFVTMQLFFADSQFQSILTTGSQVIVSLSSALLAVVVGIAIAQHLRVWFAKRNVRNHLKQLKQGRNKNRKSTNSVSTLRERLLTDLDADRSREGSSGGTAGDENYSTSETGQYDDNLDVIYQLAERCFIPIHHLKFQRRIAQGSFGVVYETLWQTTGTTVAVKILKNYNEEAKVEFLREASILSELRHPNIVMFLGVSLKNESFCIVTEFATKGSLQDALLCESLIAWNTKIRICMEIVKALGYLHSYTPMILHRDLKSRNILLDGNMSVKLCDFGLAKHEQGTTNTANIGTVHFMAPEIITGGKYSTKCDIYSFAIVMWEIFYQREPYSGDVEVVNDGGRANQFTLPLRVVQGLRPTEYANQRQIVWEGSDSEVEAEVKEKYLYIMRRCWSAEPDERPDITWILTELQSLLV